MIAGLVLAGGSARRMGGADKAALTVGGIALLDRVLTAARPVCDRLVVVGAVRPTAVGGVEFVAEAQPGRGPVPAVLTGVAASPGCDVVLVMATDLPLLGSGHLRRLVAALDQPGVEAAAAADEGGPNPLLAAYRLPGLLARVGGSAPGSGWPARRLLPPSVMAVELGAATVNVNRPEDLAAAEVLVGLDERAVVAVQWLRRLVTTTAPDAVESVHLGGRRFRYRHPQAGSFCAVVPRADGVKLSFEHGALLGDPAGVLGGEGNHVRHVEVRACDDPPAPVLVALIRAAVALGPAPLGDDQR